MPMLSLRSGLVNVMTRPAVFARFRSSRTILLLSLASALIFFAGCSGDTCLVGVINGPNSGGVITTENGSPVCPGMLPAAVNLTAQLAPACTGCSTTQQVSSVHLAVSGVELHPGVIADENSADWQEIAPDLARHPVQLELSQNLTSINPAQPAAVSGRIPSGMYYQLRLRLADPSSPQAMQLSAMHPCDLPGASCLATADGARQPVRTLDGTSYLHVAMTSPIDVRAGQPNRLHLEFNPEWLLQYSSTGAIEAAPLLHGRILNEAVPAAGTR